jgi:hypothetical protein
VVHEMRERSVVRRCVEGEVGDDGMGSRGEVPRDNLLREGGGVGVRLPNEDVAFLVTGRERASSNFDQLFEFRALRL